MDTTTIKINNTNSQSVEYAFFGANVSSATVLTDGATIASVRAATVSSIPDLSKESPFSSSFDGITVIAGDRILLVVQDVESENGIYVITIDGVGNASLSRATDYDTSAEVNNGDLISVTEGDTYAGETFRLDTADPITVGTTSLTFVLANSSIIDIENRSFDEMQRQSASNPFTINTLKVRWDNDSQASERIRITYKNMTGTACEEEFFPIDYIEQSNNRSDLIVIKDFNKVITGNVTIQGTVLANTALTFIVNSTLTPLPPGLEEFSSVHFFEDCMKRVTGGR